MAFHKARQRRAIINGIRDSITAGTEAGRVCFKLNIATEIKRLYTVMIYIHLSECITVLVGVPSFLGIPFGVRQESLTAEEISHLLLVTQCPSWSWPSVPCRYYETLRAARKQDCIKIASSLWKKDEKSLRIACDLLAKSLRIGSGGLQRVVHRLP